MADPRMEGRLSQEATYAGADPGKVERFLELLDRLGESMAAVEAGPQDFGTGVPLHRAETHAIRVVGTRPGINLTTLARTLGVTKGAASQLVTRLVAKQLVDKTPSAESGREIVLHLTERGWQGFEGHEHFHRDVLRLVSECWAPEPNPRLDATSAALQEVIELVTAYARHRPET